MSKNVKVNLFSAQGERQIEITPKGFPTRHIKLGSVKETPPVSPRTLQPVLPAFRKAWSENAERVIDFLSEGFNLPYGRLRDELNTAITAQYAPRKERTPDHWRALTADLELQTWTWGHWIFALKHRLWQKYERHYTGTPLTDETVLTVLTAIHETNGFKWILFDEILKVATVSFKVKTSGDPLRDVLRGLYQQGRVEHKTNPQTPRTKQSMFRRVGEKNNRQALLADVDAILANGGQTHDENGVER